MANKRMFAASVVETDKFLDLPVSTQALYFHLGMHGDDDGFVSSPKRVARTVGCGSDDLKLLITKGFVIPFDTGIIVIADWQINNTLRNDRYRETIYKQEKALLSLDESKRYQIGTDTDGIPVGIPLVSSTVSSSDPQLNVTKHNVTKHNPTEGNAASRRFTPPSLDAVAAYCTERGNSVDPDRFVNFYESKGWMIGKSKMKDWRAAVRNWERNSTGSKVKTAADYRRGAEECF